MNEFLAELYGTAENLAGEEDLEKNAAAEFLVKLAAEEGVDLASLSDEEVGELLMEVEKQAGVEEEVEDEATEEQEKLAEADFLGRAMAHAYVDELTEIEKQARTGAGALFSHLKGVAKEKGMGAATKEFGRSQKQGLKSMGRAIKSLVTGKAPSKATVKGGKKMGLTVPRRKGESVRRTALRGLRGAASVSAPTLAAGGAALAGGGYAAKKMMGKDEQTKKSFDEAFENAALERAYDMLADAGYDVEKVAEVDVEVRALQMLEDAGYPVEWSE